MTASCFSNNVKFIKSESELKGVDPDLRGIAQNINKIPYAGTYEVSCSGHFEEYDNGRADILPYGSLSIVLCIKKSHIEDLVKEIFDFKDEHEGMSICLVTDKNIHHDFAKELDNINDINKEQAIGRTAEGYDITNLLIKQDYLGSMGPDFSPHIVIRVDRTFSYYEKAKQRYKEIKKNWGILESRLGNYCLKYRFNNIDFGKKEFAPFGQSE